MLPPPGYKFGLTLTRNCHNLTRIFTPGHNSLDDPRITQPVTYQMIDKHPPVLKIYTNKLIGLGLVTSRQIEEKERDLEIKYEQDYLAAKSYTPDPAEWLASNWQGKAIGSLVAERPYNQTGVDVAILKQIGSSLTKAPEDFSIHPDIKQLLQQRKKMLETDKGITMAFAESLAFGCLMAKFGINYFLLICILNLHFLKLFPSYLHIKFV